MGSIALHEVVASFSLPEQAGGRVSLFSYKHGAPLVLVVCGQDDNELLNEFARHYEAYRAAGAEVLAVVPAGPSMTQLPYPVLIDEDQRVTARLSPNIPAVLVLDSYNELFQRFYGPWHPGPPHGELLSWLQFTQLQCPECDPQAWPWPDEAGASDGQRSDHR